MSIESWEKEFYPIEAEDFITENKSITPEKEFVIKLVDHSIKKWIGLLPAPLKRHNLKFKDGIIEDKDWPSSSRVILTQMSCTLCVEFYNDKTIYLNSCDKCPLYMMEPTERCTNEYSTFWEAEYSGKVLQMVKLLKSVRQWVIDNWDTKKEEV